MISSVQNRVLCSHEQIPRENLTYRQRSVDTAITSRFARHLRVSRGIAAKIIALRVLVRDRAEGVTRLMSRVQEREE